jgi:hypothetical protein
MQNLYAALACRGVAGSQLVDERVAYLAPRGEECSGSPVASSDRSISRETALRLNTASLLTCAAPGQRGARKHHHQTIELGHWLFVRRSRAKSEKGGIS